MSDKLKLFISHSSKDEYVVEPLVAMLEKLGFNTENLFCSHFAEYGVPFGEKTLEYLKKEFITKNLYVIYLLSPNYYTSPVCLNEMGASWVLSNASDNILLPDFEYADMAGTIDDSQISLKLDSSDVIPRLNQMKDKLIDKFELSPTNSISWERYRDEFLTAVNRELSLFSFAKSFIFCQNSDGNEMEQVYKRRNETKIKADFSNFSGNYGGIVVSPTKKDWNSFLKAKKNFFVNILCTGGFKGVDIEIKGGERTHTVYDKFFNLTSTETQCYIDFSEMDVETQDLKNITEVVFLFKKANFIQPCEITISNCTIK